MAKNLGQSLATRLPLSTGWAGNLPAQDRQECLLTGHSWAYQAAGAIRLPIATWQLRSTDRLQPKNLQPNLPIRKFSVVAESVSQLL